MLLAGASVLLEWAEESLERQPSLTSLVGRIYLCMNESRRLSDADRPRRGDAIAGTSPFRPEVKFRKY